MTTDVIMSGERVVDSDDIRTYKERLIACASLEQARSEFKELLKDIISESSKVCNYI